MLAGAEVATLLHVAVSLVAVRALVKVISRKTQSQIHQVSILLQDRTISRLQLSVSNNVVQSR
jgi:hypothetical protein